MQPWLLPYMPTLWSLAAIAGLMLLQLLVADVAAIRVHHLPGTPVLADSRLFLFRATRAHANTIESIAIFILAALFGMFSAASAAWLNALAWVYVGARVGHMLFYYLNRQLLRSIAFAVAVLALFGMLVVGLLAWR